MKDRIKEYLQNINEGESIVDALIRSRTMFHMVLDDLSEEKSRYKYEADKWSIKEIIAHVIDCEHIFSYRTLAIARSERQYLLGFDHNEYAELSGADTYKKEQLMKRFDLVRDLNLDFFRILPKMKLSNKGRIGNSEKFSEIDLTTLGYLISAHTLHHLNVISKKYL